MSIIKAGDINLEYYVEGSGPPLFMMAFNNSLTMASQSDHI